MRPADLHKTVPAMVGDGDALEEEEETPPLAKKPRHRLIGKQPEPTDWADMQSDNEPEGIDTPISDLSDPAVALLSSRQIKNKKKKEAKREKKTGAKAPAKESSKIPIKK